MASETVQLAAAHPVRIYPNGDQVTVTLSGTSAFYAQSEQVSTSRYDGTLTNTQSLALTAGTSFLAASQPCALVVTRSPLSAALGSVSHGANAGLTRPSTSAPVIWIGSVSPSNGRTGDLWVRTA